MNSLELVHDRVSKHVLPLLLCYAFFIVYGSLVPLEFNNLSFDTALSRFKSIPWLNLGPYARADWIANILLYVPFSFLFCAQIHTRKEHSFVRLLKTTTVLIVSLVLAIGIEFLQQFFPPRTVSLNDLLAESIGSVAGIVIWSVFGWRIVSSLHNISHDRDSLDNVLVFYLLAYLLHALFPFDFITSFAELTNISTDKIAWTIRGSKGGLFYFGWSVTQVALSVPVGFFFFRWFKKHYLSPRLITALAFGFGLLIESIQIFLISGYFSGLAVITRFIGIVAGFQLFQRKTDLSWVLVYLRHYLGLLLFPYLAVLAYFNGWRINAGVSQEQLSDNIAHIKWLPFYYHYFQPETAALTSLLYVLMMYIPIGIAVYLLPKIIFRKLNLAVFTAFVLAVIMESGKLFFSVKHPDPTNAIIAAASGWLGFYWMNYFMANASGESRSDQVRFRDQGQSFGTTPKPEPQAVLVELDDPLEPVGWAYRVFGLLLIGFSIWQILEYPVFSITMFLGISAYIILLWKFPRFWLVAIPALVPVLDTTVSSGRLFFNEIDYFLLVTVAMGLFSGRWHISSIGVARFGRFFYLILFLLLISYSASLVQGMLPLPDLDDNALVNYYSRFNALRIVKGFVWAVMLLPLFAAEMNIVRAKRYFSVGILVGLTGVILISIWERIVFSGWANYDSEYRITASFSSMHTGGGHIDDYLMLTVPFILILVMGERIKLYKVAAAMGIFALSIYVVMVTFSRGPYIGLFVEMIVFTIVLVFKLKHIKSWSWSKVLYVPATLLLVAIVIIPVFQGKYIQERFSLVGKDYQIRKDHWQDAIDMMDDDLSVDVIGMGLGSYPRTYYWRNSENTLPATYQFQNGADGRFLKLWSGDSLYFEQKIAVVPRAQYKLLIDVRGNSGKSVLTVPICEKALLYSFNCVWQTFQIPAVAGEEWQHVEKTVDTKKFAAGDGFFNSLFRRPVKLSLYNGVRDTVIDIKSVHLLDADGNDLIQNSDFTDAMDHWFFSTDNHLPWHIKNIWVQVLFEQGWFGLIVFSCFVVYCLLVFGKGIAINDSYAAIGLISLSGFLVVGFVDSPFDEPRLTLLFYLICFVFLAGQNKAIRPSKG
ncbi:VanZ family protein [Methylomonas methanica]|uniref:VanZ family protein n=1 Tax=Methylomonas methanica (strain DSM 25384 / MC09) TaxID=857087 RepID=F9ZYI9_METMM|nr:VanZ family protein [Methylomonas methanica]AEG02261.1 VanZ family protein [Methylomonas methanica MC09]